MPVPSRYDSGRPTIAYALCDAVGRPLVERNGREVFYAASTVKLAVALAVLRAVDARSLSLADELSCPSRFASGVDAPDFTVEPEDADPTYPGNGVGLPVAELVGMMISHSSNEATNVLVGRVGLPAVGEVLRLCGALESRMERLFGDVAAAAAGRTNAVTARDLTVLMRAAVSGELTTQQSAQFLRQLLCNQEHVRIGAVVPAPVIWGSKSGDVPGIEHDVAFIGDPSGPDADAVRYLAVCTRGYEPDQGREAIAAIAAALVADRNV